MQFRLSVLALALASCSPSAEPAPPVPSPTQAAAGAATQLSPAEKAKIGRKIWQNESGGSIDGLTAWNDGEQFPSLGIGHFIWYPANYRGPFTESFPQFIRFAQQRSVVPPAVARQRHSPWTSQAHFRSNFRGREMSALRNWLSSTVTLQTDFIIAKSKGALPKILASVPASDRARVAENYRKVATTPNGQYALIDYVNFKGEGTSPSERYSGKGWGLAQVLQDMRPTSAGQAAAREFAAAAKRTLGRRIQNSPAGRGESRWRAGWFNRCDTYARPL